MPLKRLPWIAASLTALAFFACAGTSSKTPLVQVSADDMIYLAPLELPDSLNGGLEPWGWDTARFERELRQEIVYQFRQRGVGIIEDSARAKAGLALVWRAWTRDGGLRLSGEGSLVKEGKTRRFDLAMDKGKRASDLERSDPTIDRIREIAKDAVAQSMRDPKGKPKKKPESAIPTVLWIF